MDARFEESGRQFVKFSVVGTVGTVVNLAVLKSTLFAWGHLVGDPTFGVEIFASGLAFCIAVVNNYLLNRWWTFRATGSFTTQFLKFFIVSCCGLALNELAFWLFRGRLDIDVLVSQGLAILCVLPFNFFVNKLWSFREDH
ncbi:MAG: GtrA family protein [Actinobacteria bacterium]|nr:GtrA family protein [Actinomycetota bacterium]